MYWTVKRKTCWMKHMHYSKLHTYHIIICKSWSRPARCLLHPSHLWAQCRQMINSCLWFPTTNTTAARFSSSSCVLDCLSYSGNSCCVCLELNAVQSHDSWWVTTEKIHTFHAVITTLLGLIGLGLSLPCLVFYSVNRACKNMQDK